MGRSHSRAGPSPGHIIGRCGPVNKGTQGVEIIEAEAFGGQSKLGRNFGFNAYFTIVALYLRLTLSIHKNADLYPPKMDVIRFNRDF